MLLQVLKIVDPSNRTRIRLLTVILIYFLSNNSSRHQGNNKHLTDKYKRINISNKNLGFRMTLILHNNIKLKIIKYLKY